MATSLKALRQAVGKALAECYVGHVEGATENTLSDSALVDLGSASSRFVGGWVKLTTGAQRGAVRGVIDYAPTTGQLTLSRSWTVPAATDEFELHWMLSPTDLDEAINEGLTHCCYVREVVLGVVPGQRNYSLAAYTWLARKPQVRAVFWRQADGAGGYRYLPVAWWQVREDSGVLTLDIQPSSAQSVDAGQPGRVQARAGNAARCWRSGPCLGHLRAAQPVGQRSSKVGGELRAGLRVEAGHGSNHQRVAVSPEAAMPLARPADARATGQQRRVRGDSLLGLTGHGLLSGPALRR